MSITKVRKSINRYFYARNRVHYLKWVINSEWSVRYFFTYDAQPEHNRTFVLKSHYKKIYVTLTKKEALEYIEKYCKYEPKEYFSLMEFKKGYRRLIVDPIIGADLFIENKKKKIRS